MTLKGLMILTMRCITQIFHIEANQSGHGEIYYSPDGELEMQVEFW
jgi:hypothetical protein